MSNVKHVPKWKDKNLDFQKIVKVAFFSIIVGIIGTFPPFFELF